MHKKIILPLKSKPKFFYNEDKLDTLKKELEEFLNIDSNNYMNNIAFAEKCMGCQEIQSNNSVEGYHYDVNTIMQVIGSHHEYIEVPEKREKIIKNLYNGYKKILTTPEINKENLKELYGILSNGLLEDDDIQNMGENYREGAVYIKQSKVIGGQVYVGDSLDDWEKQDEGAPYNELEESMDTLFEYLNNANDLESPTDYFIKSQIAHYYFVHLHPYFDVNGRTSRTLGMWYLLNNKVYPYIIFNRAIPLTIKKYYKIIKDVNRFKNVTFFLNYMLENVKVELEKECVIESVKDNIHGDLSESEYQTILYILSMNGNRSFKDYATFYNKKNEKKSVIDIRDEYLLPLVDKNILKIIRGTNMKLNDGTPNYVFKVNPDYIDNDPKKIKRLKL